MATRTARENARVLLVAETAGIRRMEKVSTSPQPIRVLLVEDDADDYVLTRDLLTLGYSPGG